jgi:hypothetical protein
MDTALIDQRVRALATARACAAFGARPKTVHHLTGLRTQEIQRLLFTHRGPHLRGRAPDTPEWFHRANLPSRCEASIVVVSFLRIRSMGFSGTDALIEAYRYYRSMHPAPSRISFDRAFDLVAHSTGLWFARCASFCTSWCRRCWRASSCASALTAGFERELMPLVRGYARFVHLLPATVDNYFRPLAGCCSSAWRPRSSACRGRTRTSSPVAPRSPSAASWSRAGASPPSSAACAANCTER